jgi:hypothetical protein
MHRRYDVSTCDPFIDWILSIVGLDLVDCEDDE